MIPFIFISSNIYTGSFTQSSVNLELMLKPVCVVLLQSVSVAGAESWSAVVILPRVMRGPIGFLIVSCSSLTGRQY
jgi:hypothetical protein